MRLSDTHRLSSHSCPRCGHTMDCASGLSGDRPPGPGDISLCINCGGIALYTEDLQLREPTGGEEYEIRVSDSWPEIAHAIGLIQRLNKSHE